MFSFLPPARRARVFTFLAALFGFCFPSFAQDVLIAPGAVDFGSMPQGRTGGAWTLTVNNTTAIVVTLGTIALSDQADFKQSNNCGATLAPYSNCSVQVAFAPSKTGAITGQLLVPNSSASSQQSVALTGNGTPGSGTGSSPRPVFAPTAIDFGSQSVSTKSNAYTITLNNQGAGELDIASLKASDPADFSVSSDCGTVLGAYSTCHVQIAFAPSAVGPITGTVQLLSNASPISLSLAGNGMAAAASVLLAPGAIDFGTQPAGVAGNPWTVSVSNTGDNDVSLTNAGVGNPSVFGVSSACGSVLKAHSSCNIAVAFTPALAGAVDDKLSVSVNGTPQSITLHGTGATAQASLFLSPASVDFGSVTAGTVSGAWTLSVNNITSSPATLAQALAVSGSSAFAMTTNCPAIIPAHTTCTITVTFAPTAAGPYTGQISALLQGSNTAQTITLAGTATPAASAITPAVLLSPGAVDFGSYDIGTSANAWTINVANPTGSDIVFSTPIAVAGSQAFHITTNCGMSLAKYASCNVQVSFAPNALGPLKGQIVVNVGGGSLQTVTLTGNGTGTAPTPTVTLKPAVLSFGSVAAGSSSAAQVLTITNTGTVEASFTSPLALTGSTAFRTGDTTCHTTLAAGASCTVAVTFSPADASAATGELVATFDGLSAALTSAFDGTGTQGQQLSITPAAFDFGTVTATKWASTTLTVTNSGGVSVQPIVSSMLTGQYDETDTENTCDNNTIDPGQTCTITLKVMSFVTQNISGTVTVASNTGASSASTNFTAQVISPVVTATPAALDFGSVAVGTTAKKVVTLTNTNSVAATVVDLGLSTSSYTSQAAGCAPKLAPLASCQVVVSFTPSQSGAVTDELDENVEEGSMVAIPVTGSGAAAPSLSFTPASFDFGKVGTWSGPRTKRVVITNTGTSNLTLHDEPTIVSSNVTLATWSYMNYCDNTPTLAPGQSCNIDVSANVYGTATYYGVMTLTPQGGSPMTMTFSITGVTPTVTMTPASVNFGSVNLGSTTLPQTVVIANPSTVPATPSITMPANSAYALSANTCTAAIPAGASCSLSFTYGPSVAGASSGSVGISLAESTTAYTIALSGTGVAVPVTPPMTVTPSAGLVFPVTGFGQTSAGQTLTITNTSKNTEQPTGSFAAASTAFRVALSTCPVYLTAGSSCVVWITYTAQHAADSGTFTVVDLLSSFSVATPLSGTGVTPNPLVAIPGALSFGNFPTGQTYVYQSLMVANTGSVPMPLNVQINDPNFAFDPYGCPVMIAPGNSCQMVVLFSPVQAGPISAALVLSAPGYANTNVPLTGTGPSGVMASDFSVSTNAIVFPSTAVGSVSGMQTVTITNITTRTVNFSIFSNTIEFPTVASTCGNALPAHASCTITMEFVPAITGPSQGFLRVSTSDGALPAAVQLLGTGGLSTAKPSYTITVNPTELTLASGQAGTALFTLTPTGGYQGTITLACAGLPAGVSCSFAPPTLTADGSNHVLTSTLTVSTTGINGSHASLGLLPALMLLLLAFTRKRFRKGMVPLAMLLVAAAFTGSMTGCGTGMSDKVTPVGAHSVTVTATASANGTTAAQTQLATFTLNITK